MGAFLMVLGTGLDMFGKFQAGEEQYASAKHNATILNQRAKAVESASASETSRMHKEARGLKAEQLAAASKSGAAISEGTPLAVLAEQAGIMEMDIMEQRRTRAIEAQGLRSQAKQTLLQGKQARKAARFSMLGPLGGLASSFID